MSFVDGGQTGGRFVLELVVALYKRDSYAPNVTTNRTLLLWSLVDQKKSCPFNRKEKKWVENQEKKEVGDFDAAAV